MIIVVITLACAVAVLCYLLHQKQQQLSKTKWFLKVEKETTVLCKKRAARFAQMYSSIYLQWRECILKSKGQ